MQDFTKLLVWQRAHSLRLDIHRASRAFPREELYVLTSQLRRSASSIGANIAESSGYGGGADSARFIQYSPGSRAETLDHLIEARDLKYLPAAQQFDAFALRLDEVGRMLVALMRRMNPPPS